jgi:hypothetical protein
MGEGRLQGAPWLPRGGSSRSASPIPSVWASWVKLGEEGLKTCLEAGVDDLGGRSIDESMSRAAGASRRGNDAAPAWARRREPVAPTHDWIRQRALRASRPRSPRRESERRNARRTGRRMTSTLRAGPSRLYPELRRTNGRVGAKGVRARIDVSIGTAPTSTLLRSGERTEMDRRDVDHAKFSMIVSPLDGRIEKGARAE